MAAMPPGFYNLVVMVEERKPDDNTVAETRNAASVKVRVAGLYVKLSSTKDPFV